MVYQSSFNSRFYLGESHTRTPPPRPPPSPRDHGREEGEFTIPPLPLSLYNQPTPPPFPLSSLCHFRTGMADEGWKRREAEGVAWRRSKKETPRKKNTDPPLLPLSAHPCFWQTGKVFSDKKYPGQISRNFFPLLLARGAK